MKLSKTTWWMLGGLGVSVISIGGFMLLNRRLKRQKIGQDTTDSLKENSVAIVTSVSTRQIPNWNNPFDMNYTKEVQQWLGAKPIVVLDTTTAKKYAQKIKKAKGLFNDDEATIKTIFSKNLKDKTNVSNISRAFWELYKKDMWQYLASFLSASELQTYVNKYVRSLPNYTLAS